jgi:hypothetical protein
LLYLKTWISCVDGYNIVEGMDSKWEKRLSGQTTWLFYNASPPTTTFFGDLIHGRDIDLGNGPDLTALAGAKSSVRSTASLGNGITESGISTGQGDGCVQVLLSSNSARAAAVALGTGTVSI